MEWPAFGLRDGMLLLVALAAIYLAVMLLKLVQVGRQRPPRTEPEQEPAAEFKTRSPLRQRHGVVEAEPAREPAVSASTAASAYAEAAASEPFAVTPAPTFEWGEVKDLFGESEATQSPPSSAPQPATRPPGFGEHLADHLARSEVEMEVQRMRDEMERMRDEMEELRAARRVSPQYAEAMELAQRGLSAQQVADHLGISLAEAELVHALSRGGKHFDEGDEDGADRYADDDRFGHGNGLDEFGRRRNSGG